MQNYKSKIVGKLSQLNIRYKSRLMRLLRPLSSHVIHIDGGIGSQIMQYSLYLWLKDNGKKVQLDTSYFENQSSRSEINWVKTRPWRLDYFGYHRDDQIEKKGLRLLDRDFMHLYSGHYSRIVSAKDFLQRNFPANTNNFIKSVKDSGLSLKDVNDSIVIHVRQGDFITAASLLLSESYYLDSLSRARKECGGVANLVLIVSDEQIDRKRFPKLAALIDADTERYRVLIGGDEIFTHNLMRYCRVLICSNSTFSFSAAMLKTSGLAIYPEKFYEGETAELNSIFKLKAGIGIPISRVE